MVAEMEEQVWNVFGLGDGGGGINIVLGIFDTFGEKGCDRSGCIATSKEAIPEVLESYTNVRGVGAKSVDAKDHAGDKATKHTRGV